MTAGIEKMYYDGNGKLVIIYSNSLLGEFSNMFQDAIKKQFPEAEIKIISETKHVISIPSDFNDFSENPKLSEDDESQIDLIVETLEDFEEDAIMEKSGQYEIIPLEGYSVENIIEDIKSAVHDKRNLCIIDTYDNYQRYNKGELFEINHVKFEYLSDDYNDTVCYCLMGDIKGLGMKVIDKMSLGEWI